MRPGKATCRKSGSKMRNHLWHTKSSVVEVQSCEYFLITIDNCATLKSSPLLNDAEYKLRLLRQTDVFCLQSCGFRSAATSSFVRTFKGEKMDYDRYILSCISEVTADDVLNVVVSLLVPIFGPSSKLAVACPTSKLDYVHDYFKQKGWSNLKKVSEEDLFTAFVASDDA